MDSSSQQPSTPQGQSRDYRIWKHIKHNVFQANSNKLISLIMPIEQAYNISELMSKNPANILRMNKGTISVGKDGDLVLVDLNKEVTIE